MSKSWYARVEMSFVVDVLVNGDDEEKACANAEAEIDTLANDLSIDLEYGPDNHIVNCTYGVRAIEAYFNDFNEDE